ncbi:MAG TPA: hypothetical protein VHV77_06550, partial [Pirellulales bacterium]|nr:hypothetical protein [Pirellulales bacterium]
MGSRRAFRWRLACAFVAVVVASSGVARAEEAKSAAANSAALNSAAASDVRLGDSVRYLADDALEGRGVGTEGLDKAADYIVGQFEAVGLKTDVVDGKPFQKFTATVGTELGKPNDARFVKKAKGGDKKTIALDLGKTFTPLSIGGSGKLDAPLVFAGYGITAKDLDYDDYADLDVKGKAVIVFRHEPQQSDPHSAFDGTQHSQYAPFTRKVSNA